MNDQRVKHFLKYIKDNKGFRIALSLILLMVMVIVTINIDLNQTQSLLENNQKWAFFIGVTIYFALGFTLVPTGPLTIFNAIILGPIESIAIAVTGNMLSAFVGYQLGKALVITENIEAFKNSLPEWVQKYKITSPIVLMIGRILPMGRIPLSYLCGAYRIPLLRYCWSSLMIYILTASLLSFSAFGLGVISSQLF